MTDDIIPQKDYNPTTLRQLQLKCLEILDIVVKICQNNNITYSLCGGSVVGNDELLGVRHAQRQSVQFGNDRLVATRMGAGIAVSVLGVAAGIPVMLLIGLVDVALVVAPVFAVAKLFLVTLQGVDGLLAEALAEVPGLAECLCTGSCCSQEQRHHC